MTRILFVCLGNICRSPMAEFVLKDIVKQQGLEDRFEIASAATSQEELGNPPHSGTRQKLREHGISCTGKTARLLEPQDYYHYDLIVGMDSSNVRNILRLMGGDPGRKVHRLLDFAGRDGDIADPWYTGNFEATWQDVQAGCMGLLRALASQA